MTQRQSAVAILPCIDLNESQAFYERLGFALAAAYDSQGYRILQHPGGGSVHLNRVGPEWVDPERNAMGIYFYSPDVEALASEFGRTAESKPWGMREFAVPDPNGTLVRIGWP